MDSGNPNINSIFISNVANCNVDANDTITFGVTSTSSGDPTLAIVVNGENANIFSTTNTVTVRSIPGGSAIDFFTDDGQQSLNSSDVDLDVLSSSIDCGNNNNNNNNNNHRRHRHGNNNNNG